MSDSHVEPPESVVVSTCTEHNSEFDGPLSV